MFENFAAIAPHTWGLERSRAHDPSNHELKLYKTLALSSLHRIRDRGAQIELIFVLLFQVRVC